MEDYFNEIRRRIGMGNYPINTMDERRPIPLNMYLEDIRGPRIKPINYFLKFRDLNSKTSRLDGKSR